MPKLISRISHEPEVGFLEFQNRLNLSDTYAKAIIHGEPKVVHSLKKCPALWQFECISIDQTPDAVDFLVFQEYSGDTREINLRQVLVRSARTIGPAGGGQKLDAG